MGRNRRGAHAGSGRWTPCAKPATIARRSPASLTRIAADVAERPHARSGLVPSGGAGDRAASRDRGGPGARGGRRPRRPRSARAGRAAPSSSPMSACRCGAGPTEGRVRILSPYRLRATRVAHLFVAGLADGSFPAGGGGDPLLSDERRRALGLLSRSDPAAEERYLFYTCVSKPDRCLHLSYPASDEAGGTAPRSAFVDEVRDLLAPAPTPDPADDPLEPELIERATLADFVPAPEDASAPHDLARALAAVGADAEERAAGLDLPEGAAERAVAAVAAARRRVRAARAPGPISHPDILASLAAHDLFGASTLEEYHLCSYRWFVNHELDPRRIEPDPEPLENGGIVHATLERLFGEPPGEGARPTPETVGRWIERAHGIVREVAVERGWDLEAAAATISLARLDAVLEPLPAPRRRDRRAADARSRPARGRLRRPARRPVPGRRPRRVPSPRCDRPDRRQGPVRPDPRLQAERQGHRRRGPAPRGQAAAAPVHAGGPGLRPRADRRPLQPARRRARRTGRGGCSTRSTSRR